MSLTEVSGVAVTTSAVIILLICGSGTELHLRGRPPAGSQRLYTNNPVPVHALVRNEAAALAGLLDVPDVLDLADGPQVEPALSTHCDPADTTSDQAMMGFSPQAVAASSRCPM